MDATLRNKRASPPTTNMPSLTGISSCESCVGLSQKVAELETQISTLFRLQAERDQEVILGKTQAAATSAELADTAHFCPREASHHPPASSAAPSASAPAPSASAPPASDEDYWFMFGAKPKVLICSTPRKSSPWIEVAPKGHSRSSRTSSPHKGRISLGNRFSALVHESASTPPKTRPGKLHFTPAPDYRHVAHDLEKGFPPIFHESEFPPLNHRPPPPSLSAAVTQSGVTAASSLSIPGQRARCGQSDAAARSSSMSSTHAGGDRGAPSAPPLQHPRRSARGELGAVSAASSSRAPGQSVQREPGGSSAAVAPDTHQRSHQAPANPAPEPTVLVLGTSMVRHVRVIRGRTSCHPGAHVVDINNSAPDIIRHNPSASTVVIHAGLNDLKLQQSETLKDHFKTLITTIHSYNKHCIISGPIPAPRFGDVKFSRVRLLHLWLKNYCLLNQIPYVDNFLTFFNRPELFKKDRLHPNIPGSRLLSMNIEMTIKSSS